jgi:hypothetical protein
MNLREEESTTTSPLLCLPGTTSIPTTTPWTAGISFLTTIGPSSVERTFDHSFTDGVSQELHFELPQYGPINYLSRCAGGISPSHWGLWCRCYSGRVYDALAFCYHEARSSFMCVVYGFQLWGKVWFVFVVLDLDVLGLLRWLLSMIRVDPPYLFLCIYHLPKRHMKSNFLYSFINFLYSS